MKRALLVACVTGLSFLVHAQIENSHNEFFKISLTTNKTTGLVFSEPIRYVDIGTNEIIARQVPGAENILLLKSVKPRFAETNISVIMDGGKLYSLSVQYDSLPVTSVYTIGPKKLNTTTDQTRVRFVDEAIPADELQKYTDSIFKIRDKRFISQSSQGDINAVVNGLFIHQNIYFFRLILKNQSSIPYQISFIRFFIKDEKKHERSGEQERDIEPVKIVSASDSVNARGKKVMVFAIPKFTLQKRKLFLIKIHEKDGARTLTLPINERMILNAVPL